MNDLGAEWSTSSNNAVHISLVVPSADGPKSIHSFHPKITSSMFGEGETIAGYKDLKINLRYHASDMRPSLQITYSKKMKNTGEACLTDLKELFEAYLPKSSFEKTSVFDATLKDSRFSEWRPPGELWKTIQSGDQTYEVWKGNLADLKMQQMVKRLQIFVSFFIEGGTPIELKEPEWSLQRWTIFFLYHKQQLEPDISPYVFMGYSTVYQYFFIETRAATKNANFKLPLPEIQFSSLPCRSRISQFIILPPFQGAGNGSRFYNAIFDYYLQEFRTVEITVEDPNEAFDDLRDLNDLARLRRIPDFIKLKINPKTVISKKASVPGNFLNQVELEKIRKDIKIAPRQFNRIVELQLLSTLLENPHDNCKIGKQTKIVDLRSNDYQNQHRIWELLVKARLFHHNRDALIQLDFPDRIQKLDQTLWNVRSDYKRLLKAHEIRFSPRAIESSPNYHTSKRTLSNNAEDGEHIAKKAKKT